MRRTSEDDEVRIRDGGARQDLGKLDGGGGAVAVRIEPERAHADVVDDAVGRVVRMRADEEGGSRKRAGRERGEDRAAQPYRLVGAVEIHERIGVFSAKIGIERERVLSFSTEEDVRPRTAEERIITGLAEQVV